MRVFLVSIFFFCSTSIFAKNNNAVSDSSNTEIFSRTEVMPSYPGGMAALFKFLQDNIVYPDSAKINGNSGKVIIRFYIDTDGRVKDPIVIKDGVGGGCADEAIRVMHLMPKWTPGIQDGKAVKVNYTLPITFTMGNNSSPKQTFYKAFPLNGYDSLQNYLKTVSLKIKKPKKDKNLVYSVKALITVLENGKIGSVVINETNVESKYLDILKEHIRNQADWSPEWENKKPRISLQEIHFSF